jgi:hypothetical protein
VSAQIIPLRSRTLAQAWLDEDGDGRAAKLFDFQRQLNAVARETRDYIRAGQTFAAVYCAAALRRSPPEWIQRDIFAPRTCYFCRVEKGTPHKPSCDHPAAEKARKAATKATTAPKPAASVEPGQ